MVFYQCYMHKKLGWLMQVWLPTSFDFNSALT